MPRLLYLFLFFLSCALSPLFAQESFSLVLQNSEARGDAVYSALIADVKKGKIIDEYHSSQSLIPASLVKLITTASALKLLPQYPFITDFRISGEITEGLLKGDLIIRGSGDPSLYSKYFPRDSTRFRESLLVALSAYGIHQIEGSVVVTADCFEKEGFNPTWDEEDRGEWYGCGVYGFNLYDNWLDLTFQTKEKGSRPKLIKQYPSGTQTVLHNQLRTVSKGAYAHATGSELHNERILKGSLPAHRTRALLSIDLPNPPQFGADFITSLLRQHGICIENEGRASYEPTDLTTQMIGQYYGPSLESLIRICNIHSLNHYAEALLKRIAQEKVPIGSTLEGIQMEKGLWESEGIQLSKGFRLTDGSGLSRSNRLTAVDLYSILLAMSQDSSLFESFIQSLPEAGVEGSVKRFLRDTAYSAYLKSGSMRGIQCYAGYISYQEDQYIVVLLSNKVRNRKKTRQAMQLAIEAVVTP